jgi:hypothetical protein
MLPSLCRPLICTTLIAAYGGCLPAVAPSATPSALGGPCAGSSGCEETLFCQTGAPGGRCSKDCGSSAECGAGAVCEAKECFPVCRSDADCGRRDYVCESVSMNKFCTASKEAVNQKAIDDAKDQGEMYGL